MFLDNSREGSLNVPVVREEGELWEDDVFNLGHLGLKVRDFRDGGTILSSNLLNFCFVGRWSRKKI